MTAFVTKEDIGNRALGHCGAKRIASFIDNSKNAAAVSFVYDKLRRAELRRNVWRFSIRRAALRAIDTTTMLLVPDPWSATIPYQPGAIVADAAGTLWVSTTPFNLNRAPGVDPAWDVFFGPLTVSDYASGAGSTPATTYYNGEHVYVLDDLNKSWVFTSLLEGNGDNPTTPTNWSATATYNRGLVVLYTDGYYYQSLVDLNLDNVPGTYGMYNAATVYAKAAVVGADDGNLYVSLVASNTGHNPLTDDLTHWRPTGQKNPWSPFAYSTTAAQTWVRQYGTVVALNVNYPLGTGPVSQSTTRNVFRLPSGFLREAPQDPKAGATSYLGSPSGLTYNDWNLEGNYLTTRDASVILLRFVADVSVVSNMDDMFCEGLGARVGLEICEELTQSGDKLQKIASTYKMFMGEARAVNGIETGPTEPPEDDFLTCRL